MCGIYGMVCFERALQWRERLGTMGERLRHRGPDDSGFRSEARVAMGVERLRITDLRSEAAQPFTDPGGTVWVGGNGAIYNAGELRTRYRDYPYRSASDIEPIVPLFLDRGIDAVAELDGMFALAIWDGRTGRLVLARDRGGEKPLFWRVLGGEVWFASEVQALLVDHAPCRLDPAGLVDYGYLGYVREPKTLFASVRKVPAGAVLEFSSEAPRSRRYWHPEAIAERRIDAGSAALELDRLLTAAVERQTAADVPVGVFVSGGVDSSLLAALASRRIERLPTFTVGFRDASYDERGPARRLAEMLGTRHVEISAGEPQLREAFDVVAAIADTAILPTYLLAREARKHVGVVLSGEGADELFGGYPTYLGHRLVAGYRRLPAPLRRLVARSVEGLPASHAKITVEFLLRRFVAHADEDLLQRHVAWFGTGLPADVLAHRYREALALPSPAGRDALREVMYFDYRTYLPDNLLTKIDRATMLVGLEARAPFLDREVTELGLGLPSDLRVRGFATKWLLKEVAGRHLPRWIVHRRKRGLSVPVAAWLNGSLREETDRLLARERLEQGGVWSPGPTERLLAEHRAGRANHARALWPLVVFERWREHWMGA
jgi:asparagine synthase (glutamine-hydrolysing)